MNIIVVYNPRSGTALSRGQLSRKFKQSDIEVEKFITVNKSLKRRLAPYIRNGRTIAVIGGDGTVSSVAGQLVNTRATLVPLPGGTLNHFTKDLGIPQDIDEALKRLGSLKPRRIDIARVNDTYFINNSSIGLYPTTLHDREDIETKIGKWPAAVAAASRALVRMRTHTVTLDNQAVTTPFIFVGNNRYTIDAFDVERSSLDEGILTVFVAKTQSRLTLLKIMLLTLIGKVERVPELDEFHTKHLTIETSHRRLSVSHDGEVSKIAPPVEYTIKAKALNIIG